MSEREGAPASHAVRRKAMEICLGLCDWMPEVIMLPFLGSQDWCWPQAHPQFQTWLIFLAPGRFLHIPPYAPVLLWLPNGLQTFTLNNYSFLNNWAFHWKVIHVHGKKENRTVQIDTWVKRESLVYPSPPASLLSYNHQLLVSPIYVRTYVGIWIYTHPFTQIMVR